MRYKVFSKSAVSTIREADRLSLMLTAQVKKHYITLNGSISVRTNSQCYPCDFLLMVGLTVVILGLLYACEIFWRTELENRRGS